jgi:tetratricopeptide (TPR) repeat protein
MSAIGGESGWVSTGGEVRKLIDAAQEHSDRGDLDVALSDYAEALRLEPENVEALVGRAKVNRQRGVLEAAADDLSRALELDGTNLEARRLRGITLEARGLYEDALADYEIMVRESPSADAFRNLGDVHLSLGQTEQAERDYDTALEFDDRYLAAYIGRGCAYGREFEYTRAIEDFDRVLELEPDHMQARFLRGYTRGLVGQYDAALDDLREVVEHEPDAEVYARRADVHAAMGNADLAEADLGEALERDPSRSELWVGRGYIRLSGGRYGDACDDLTVALGIDGDDLEARRLRGIALEALGRYEEAFVDYDHVVQGAPSAEAFANRADVSGAMQNLGDAEADYTQALVYDDHSVHALLGRARLRGARSDYQGALEDLSIAIERDPEGLELRRLRGLALVGLGRHSDAVADLQLAADGSSDPDVCCDLGDALLELDDTAAATDAYARAIDIDERFERAWVGRGYAQGRGEDLESAYADLTTALELAPDDLYARALLAIVLDGMNRFEDALTEYGHVIDSAPSAEMLLHRGGALASVNRLEEAESDYRRATELEPGNVTAYMRLGQLAAQMEQFEAARDAFDAAISLDAANPSAHLGRGDAMVAVGEPEQAIQDYDRAIELDPRDVGALQARSRARQRLAESFQQRRLVRRMLRSYFDAVADLDQALELDPQNAGAYAEKAIVLRTLEAYDYAAQAAATGLRVADPDDDTAIWLLGEQGDALQLWGIELRAGQRLSEALESFGAAAQKIQGPSPAWLHELSGRALEGLGRHQDARREFEQAIEREPGSVSAHYALGRLLLRVGEYADALEVFERLLELAGGSYFETMQAHVGREVAFRGLGNVGEAEQSLSAAVDPEALDARVWRAIYLQEFGEGELGAAELRDAIEMDPTAGSAQNQLAWYYVDKTPSPEHLAEALALARRAVDNLGEQEDQYIALDTLGWVLFKLGQYDEAVRWLARAVEINPWHLPMRAHLEQAQAAVSTA